jgi:hypothetical protein
MDLLWVSVYCDLSLFLKSLLMYQPHNPHLIRMIDDMDMPKKVVELVS